jgi:beta-lactamase regulating signal transducer with metallopeptidase domain
MSFPNFTFWSRLLATVGVEVCCLAALGFVAQFFFRSAVWQRAVWQITMICLLLIPASELTGLGRGMAGFLFSQKRVVENAVESGVTPVKSQVAASPVTVSLNRHEVATQTQVSWPGWLWLAGALIVLGRMAAAQVLLLMLRWRREKITDPSLHDRVEHVAKCVGLRRKVSLLRMPQAISPMAFGILRPTLGLPPGFETKLSATEQDAVLAHELAHLAALDPIWFLLGDFVCALLWWHPMAWWTRRSLHGAAELAADEATALVPEGPSALAKCLVSLGKEMTAARGWGWVGINGGFRSNLGKRVERLMQMSSGARRQLAGWLGVAARIAMTILVVPTIVLLFGSFQSVHAQREDSWQYQFEESWRQSPARVLLLARRDDDPKPYVTNEVESAKALHESGREGEPAAEVNQTEIQNAKLLYEMGKYDEAEAILRQVKKDDASYRAARYYLDLIKEARYVGQTSPIPNATALANLNYTTKTRQRILSKLENIKLDRVSYDLPLKKVLLLLFKESQRLDPDGFGVNFMIIPDIGDAVTIRISPPLNNLLLIDVLNAIVMGADRPIGYTVNDYAVIFGPSQPQDQLLTKTFRVDPNTFMQSLKKLVRTGGNSANSNAGAGTQIDDDARRPGDGHDDLGGPVIPPTHLKIVTKTNSTLEAHQMVRDYFAACGLDLSPPKNIFFNDRLGVLLVRASAQDLEIVQEAIEMLNMARRQLIIEAKFVELSQEETGRLGLDWDLGSTLTNNGAIGLRGGTAPSSQGPRSTSNQSGIFLEPGALGASTVNGVMSDAESRIFINRIEQRTGADILTLPKITTESGRQAHVGVSDGHKGPTIDVIAEVGPDGFSIQTTAIASINTGHKPWQISASSKVWDGQTMVFSEMRTNQPSGASEETLVLVTLRIIDPAGNPVHSDEEISKRSGTPEH